MKILIIHPEHNSNNVINDYQSDLLLHGLRELYGNDVVDYPGSWYLYKEQVNKKNFDTNNLWGKGFNIKNILDNFNSIDRSDILNKIKKKYFNLIIFSSCRRSTKFINEAIKFNNKIVFVDGEDHSIIDLNLATKGLYFKRELTEKKKNVLPISFAIPEKKILRNITQKQKNILAPLIPGKIKTYLYNDEEDYNRMYQNSHFALTYKKVGWDCYRHYEILMNGCIPLFLDLENCPEYSLTFLPKKLLLEINQKFLKILSFENPLNIYKKKFLTMERVKNYLKNILLRIKINDIFFDDDQILEYKSSLLKYCRTNLTTKNIAKYVIKNVQ